jgi:hypothetical protein
MATKYIEEYATEAAFLADAVDASGKLGIASVDGEYVVVNKSGVAVELIDETRAQTLSSKTLTDPTIVPALVNLTAATLAITSALHNGRTITVNKADGSTLTLPAATGSGARFRIVVGTTITSVGLVISPTGNDTMFGTVFGAQDGGVTVEAWEAAAGNNTITLDGSTKGGLKGDIIELEDIAADVWRVLGHVQQTGVQATPFSTV